MLLLCYDLNDKKIIEIFYESRRIYNRKSNLEKWQQAMCQMQRI